MKQRRGQGAMEYLMTYGWAILVVMVVGIVMWQLGIFSMGTTTVTAQGFSKIKPQLAATGLREDGTFNGMFTNGAGTTIENLVVNITNEMTGDSYELANNVSAFAAGDIINIDSPPGALGNQGSAGDIYELRVTIAYTVTIGGKTASLKESGLIRGPLEAA